MMQPWCSLADARRRQWIETRFRLAAKGVGMIAPKQRLGEDDSICPFQ
jgi:hypothetical protein